MTPTWAKPGASINESFSNLLVFVSLQSMHFLEDFELKTVPLGTGLPTSATLVTSVLRYLGLSRNDFVILHLCLSAEERGTQPVK